MEIKTKFNVGDVLFTIKDMHIQSFTVKMVSVFCDNEKRVSYVEEGNLFASHKEKDCFSSKEELLAYIQQGK